MSGPDAGETATDGQDAAAPYVERCVSPNILHGTMPAASVSVGRVTALTTRTIRAGSAATVGPAATHADHGFIFTVRE